MTLLALFVTLGAFAQERETIWPKGKMPDPQDHQIAAMTDEVKAEKFKPAKHRTAYIEWFAAPAEETRNGGCMILISGGSYMNCCDVGLIKKWNEELTALGFQCVNFVYRTPRPVGLPIYQSAWEDGQRAVRMVRSEAAKRGFDPEKIGTISMSAGSHLALLLATSSQTPAYERVDALDDIPCHINWAIVNAPAYVTTDGEKGDPAQFDGYGVDVRLSDVFKFDEKTCPMSLHHGGRDVYSPNGSTLVYRQLRRMNVPAELHLYPDKGHGAYGFERGVEFMRQMGFLGKLEKEIPIMSVYADDDARAELVKEDVWPEGKMPDPQPEQCTPYIEWHIPKVLTTKAIQIIYSGGSYTDNKPDDFEVAPARRYLNAKGMTVVTLKYRTPRPVTGLAKHTTRHQDSQERSRRTGAGPGPHRHNGQFRRRPPHADGRDLLAASVLPSHRRDRQAPLQRPVGHWHLPCIRPYRRPGEEQQHRRKRRFRRAGARILIRPRHRPDAVHTRRRRRMGRDEFRQGLGEDAQHGHTERTAYACTAQALLPAHSLPRYGQLHLARPHLGLHERKGLQ